MNITIRKPIIAVFLVLIMLGSPIATAIGAGVAPSDQTEELTDNVDAWERSELPLQADTSNADTVIDELPTVILQDGTEQTQYERDSVGVFTQGTTVGFDFEDRSSTNVGGLDLDDGDTQVHAVRLEEDVPSDANESDIPGSIGELRDLLTQENVNSNASFIEIDEDITPEDDNTFSFDHEFDDPGQYAVMVTQTSDSNDGIELEDNSGLSNLESIDGDITIIGLEAVSVQETEAQVTDEPSDVEPGDDLEFDVESNLGLGSDVNHMVAVYHEDTFSDDLVTIIAPDSVDNDTDASDMEIESDIGFVSGVSNVENDFTLLGQTLEARSDSDTFEITNIVSDIADRANTSEPVIDDGETVLNASATALIDDDSTTVTVETLDDWDEGDYRYVYIASGDDSTVFSTAEDTITIEEVDDDDDDPPTTGGGGGGASPPADDDDDVGDDDDAADTPDADDLPPETPTVQEVREELDQTEPNTQSSTPIVDNAPDRPGVTVNPEETESVREITFSDDGAAGNVDIREWQDPPESVSQSVRGSVVAQVEADTEANIEASASVPTVADIDPDSDEVRGSSATVQMTVEADRLENPDDAVIAHERGDTWETLETTVTETEDGEVTLEAETESFSLFAIAEVQTEEQDEPVDDVEDPDDGIGTVGLIGLIVVLALIVVAAVAYRQMNDGGDNTI